MVVPLTVCLRLVEAVLVGEDPAVDGLLDKTGANGFVHPPLDAIAGGLATLVTLDVVFVWENPLFIPSLVVGLPFLLPPIALRRAFILLLRNDNDGEYCHTFLSWSQA